MERSKKELANPSELALITYFTRQIMQPFYMHVNNTHRVPPQKSEWPTLTMPWKL